MKGPAVEIDRVVRQVLAEQAAEHTATSNPLRNESALRNQGATAGLPNSAPKCTGEQATRGRTDRADAKSHRALAPASTVETPVAPTVLAIDAAVITFDELQAMLDAHRELHVRPRAVITPLALDLLRSRGVAVVRQDGPKTSAAPAGARAAVTTPATQWAYSVVGEAAVPETAVAALAREGIARRCACNGRTLFAEIARDLETSLSGAVIFCSDAAMAACVANRTASLRAIVGLSPEQVRKHVERWGVNLLVVDPAVHTLHELRGMLRAFCRGGGPRACSDELQVFSEGCERCASAK